MWSIKQDVVQTPTAHEVKPLPDIFQSDMRLIAIGRSKSAAVICNYDLTVGICSPCPDGNMERAGIRVPSMLDGILHDPAEHRGGLAKHGKRKLAEQVETDMSEGYAMTDRKMINTYLVILTLYEQQQYMWDNRVHSVEHRIVSLSQPWIRPIVRGFRARQ